MLVRPVRAATLKYLTCFTSGVAGLNILVQKWVVKFPYAGESTRESNRVVSDEGNRTELDTLPLLVTVSVSELGYERMGFLRVNGRLDVLSLCKASRKAPIPMFAWYFD